MKTLSWFLTLILACFLVYTFAQVPADPSAVGSHIASRYLSRGQAETGISSVLGAVLADYRSVDLLAAALLFSTTALVVLLFYSAPPKASSFLLAALCLGLGTFLALGLGFGALLRDSNFLDYEALAAWVASPRARLDGALMLSAGALLNLAGMLMLWIRCDRSSEGSSGR